MNCNKITNDKNCNILIQEDNYDNNYAFVYVLQLNKTTEITNQVFIKTSEELLVVFEPGPDGFYTLVTLKVSKDPESEYYYINDDFYHNGALIDLQELIELNPNVSGVNIEYDYYFQTCRLKKCFINICYLIFDTLTLSSCVTPKLDSNLVYKRDLLWSAMNVIRYLSEMDLYEEAERLLERIVGCNGLCDNQDSHSNSNCGCK